MRNFSRRLRGNMTDAEQRLWYRLRRREIGGHKFRRQQVIGRYIVDFVCLEKRLIVEVDGGHHDDQRRRDALRTAWLEAQRFRVVRFWNTDVVFRLDAVCEAIYAALNGSDDAGGGDPHPDLPPQGGKEPME